MTHATKVIYMLLLTDYVKVSKVSVDDILYDEQDIARTMKKIEVKCRTISPSPSIRLFALLSASRPSTDQTCCLSDRLNCSRTLHHH